MSNICKFISVKQVNKSSEYDRPQLKIDSRNDQILQCLKIAGVSVCGMQNKTGSRGILPEENLTKHLTY